MPTDCAAAWSSATARSARPVLVFWKKMRQPGHQHAGDQPAPHVELVDQDAARKRRSRTGTRRPSGTAAADRRRSRRSSAPAPSRMKVAPMVDMKSVRPSWLTSGPSTKRSISQAVIAMTTAANSRPRTIAAQYRKAARDQEVERAHQRQAGQQHHGALREIEHARRLEDQHEAERHQRIQHARQQAADQDLQKLAERNHALLLSGPRPDRRRSPPGCSAPRPACRRRSCGRSPAPPRDRTGPSPRPCRARSGRWWCRRYPSR